MIWRGPMVMGALEQMMGQVEWGALDIMIVDMPPGTGDAQLTMAQRVALAGAVIVSTPQDIALLDARRGVRMFEQDPRAGAGDDREHELLLLPALRHAGPRSSAMAARGAEAERLGVRFLGEVPLLLDIRTASDAGTPIVAAAPDSDAARAYCGRSRPGCGRKVSAERAGQRRRARHGELKASVSAASGRLPWVPRRVQHSAAATLARRSARPGAGRDRARRPARR